MRHVPLTAATATWLEHLDRDRRLAATTLKTYGSTLHVAFKGLPAYPSDDQLRAAIDARLNHPSGHVRRQAFVILSLFLQWWQDHDGPANLLAEAKPPPKPNSRRSALSPADLEALERRLITARPKDRAEVLLMLRAGFRVGDVVRLKMQDIDFQTGRVRCAAGKGGTDTWLPMTDSVADALREHLGAAGITEGWVFTGPRGRMGGQAIWKTWKRVAGPDLAHFTAHQLRNSFANQLVRSGTNLNSVRRLMRHASLVTTQRYLDDDEDGERSAVRALDGLTPSVTQPTRAPRSQPAARAPLERTPYALAPVAAAAVAWLKEREADGCRPRELEQLEEDLTALLNAVVNATGRDVLTPKEVADQLLSRVGDPDSGISTEAWTTYGRFFGWFEMRHGFANPVPIALNQSPLRVLH